MRKSIKRMIAASMVMALAIGTSGCGNGNGNGNNDSKNTSAEYVYVAEYKDIETESYLRGAQIIDNNMYYITSDYSKETPVYTYDKYDIATGEVTSIPLEIGENAYPSGICVDKDGNAVCIINEYSETGEKYGIQTVSSDGTVSEMKDITQAVEGLRYIQYMELDKEGNLVLVDDSGIYIVTTQGELKKKIPINDWIYGMGVSAEGKIIVVTDSPDGAGMAAKEIDVAAGTFGKTYENFPQAYNSSMMAGAEKGVVVKTDTGLYAYDLDTQTSKEIVNWIDCDINTDEIMVFTMTGDGDVMVVTQSWEAESQEYELVTLKKTDSSQVAAKTELILGVSWLSQDVRKAVIEFNKNSTQYRIKVKDYSDSDDPWTQFNNDVTTGNAPDIIDVSGLSYDTYASKGILEDLYPFIEKDEEIKLENYFENILKINERDGKLYSIIPQFSLNGVVARAEDFPGVDALTLDVIVEAMKNRAPDTEIMHYMTKNSILFYMVAFNSESYIDYATGECYFDTDEFKKVLEFANMFPTEFDYSEDGPTEPELIAENKVLLSTVYIGEIEELQLQRAMYGEDTEIKYFGWPSDSGSGMMIQSNGVQLAISTKSENKDGAWDFIRYFMLDEYQNSSYNWSFPISKTAFAKRLEEAAKPAYDAEGNEISVSSWSVDGFEVDIYAATKEDIDLLYSLVEGADQTYSYDEQIFNILVEETESYFAGQKSVDEVASIIQSRIKIYINESK